MMNKFYNSGMKLTAEDMIDSDEGFWVNGGPGITEAFAQRLIEGEKKTRRLIAEASPITSEAVRRVYESDKTGFIFASSETLFIKLGNPSRDARIA